jgi:hypothetical protein
MERRLVPDNHVIACASPSTAALGLNGEWRMRIKPRMRLLVASDHLQFFLIHGLYQAWRRNMGRVPLDTMSAAAR